MSFINRALFLAVAFGTIVTSGGVNAQSITSNPYAALETTKPVWPPFYKPDPEDAAYANMMAMGWCKPNGWRAQTFYQSKMMDVNVLPQVSFKGTVTSMQSGMLTAVDEKEGTSYSLIVHENPAISSVRLSGKASSEALAIGAVVRFVTQVDAKGAGLEKIKEIELITASSEQPEAIQANRTQNCVGKILRRDGMKLTVQASSGKIRRLTVELADDAVITARLTDYTRAVVGDAVSAKGRVFYSPVIDMTLFFADELDIAAVNPLRQQPAAATKDLKTAAK